MAKYFAISENATTRDHIEITNKQTGRFNVKTEEVSLNERGDKGSNYNMLVIHVVDKSSGLAIVKTIGVVQMQKFTISDCDKKCIQKMFATCIRAYEKKRHYIIEEFELPFLLEFAYPSSKK